MDLTEVLQALGEEEKNTVLSAIEAEKQKGKKAKQTADAEAIKAKTRLKELGYSAEKYSDFDEFKSTITSKVKEAETAEVTLAGLNSKLTEITNKLAETEKLTKEKAQKLREKAITKKLGAELNGKLYAAELITKANLERFEYDEEHDLVKPKEGTFEEAVKAILDENKENMKVSQAPGTGTSTGTAPSDKEKDFVDKLKERMGRD